jgi:hypothetical protein
VNLWLNLCGIGSGPGSPLNRTRRLEIAVGSQVRDPVMNTGSAVILTHW